MRWRCWLSIPVLSFALAQPVCAVPFVPDFSNGPVVFDFEDGLQGWVPDGAVPRLQTQVLGGQWPILGDGLIPTPLELEEVILSIPPDLWLDVDRTDVAG